MLDELRRLLAIDVDVLLPDGFERLQSLSRQQLQGLWSLPENEPQPIVGTAAMVLTALDPPLNLTGTSVTPLRSRLRQLRPGG